MSNRHFRPILAAIALTAALSAAQAERLPPIRAVQSERSTPAVDQLPQPSQPMRLKTPSDAAVHANAGITLDELEEIALSNNPTLTKAAAAVEAARGNWEQVGLYPNPNVAYLATQIGDRGTPGQQGGYIEQEFVRGRKLPLNRAVACREIEISQRDFASQKMRLQNDVRIHFYAALVAQHQLQITTELVTIGNRALKAAESLFEREQASRVDVLQARVEINEVQLSLVNAQNRFQAAWRQIAVLIGVPGMEQTALNGDLLEDMPEFSWEESVGRILSESPELVATRLGVDRAIWALRRARVEPIPNVTVQAGPQYDLGANQTISNVNVVLPAPVFNKNQGNIRRAEADVRAARAEVARKELELTARLTTSFERYLNARNQARQYREQIMPNALEALNLVSSGYRQGELNYLALLTTQRTYFRANLAYLEAMRELWESSITIDGLLLTDSLGGPSKTESLIRPAPMPLPISPFSGK